MAETELMRIVTPNLTSDLSPRHWFPHSDDKVSPIMIPMQKTAQDFLPSDDEESTEMQTRSNCHCSPDCPSEAHCFSLEAETTITLLPESTEEEDSASISSFDSSDKTALVIERNDKEDMVGPALSSVCLSVCLLVGLPSCLPVCPSVHLSIHLSACLSVCPSVYSSVCLLVCMSALPVSMFTQQKGQGSITLLFVTQKYVKIQNGCNMAS